MLEWSMFNYIVSDDNYTIIKNSRTLCTMKIENHVYKKLRREPIDLRMDTYKSLFDNGIIIENERKKYTTEILEAINCTGSLVIVIAPTMICNFRCKYCYEEGTHIESKKNVDEFFEHLEDITTRAFKNKELNYIKVILFGGEPTLVHSINLEKIAQLFKNQNKQFDFDIITNGYNVTDEFLEWCEGMPIDNIQVTLDGTAKYHDENRVLVNGEKTFETIFSNLSLLLNKKITNNLIIRINCTKQNIDSIKDLIKMIDEKYKDKKDMIRFSFGQLGVGESQSSNEKIQELAEYHRDFYFKIAMLFITAQNLGFQVPSEYAVGDICTNKRKNSVVISSNGVYKCMRAINRENRSVSVDNWKSTIMSPELYDDCFERKCAYIPYCHNGCLFTASIMEKEKVCRKEELEIINKLILRKMYLD